MKLNFLPGSLRTALLLFLLTAGYMRASAQITTAATYSFQAFTGTYNPIVGGTTTPSGILNDDQTVTNIPIGFTFNFCGINYTQLAASSDGFVSFGNTTACPYSNDAGPSQLTATPGMLLWFWDDVYASPGTGYNPSSSYITTGTAPNRVFTIEMSNFGFCCSAIAYISCEVKLYEGTNVIQFVYNPIGTQSSRTATIGIANSTTDWKVLSNSSSSPTASNSVFTYNIATVPGAGQIYQFAPPAPCAGTPQQPTITTNLATPICSGFNTTLNMFDPNITTGINYLWQTAPSISGPWTNIPGAPNATSYTTPGLVQNSYYRVGDSCANSGIVTYSSPVTVLVNTYAIPYTENFNTTANTSIPLCFTSNVTGSGQSRWVVNTQFHDANGVGYTVMSEDDVMGNFQYGKNAYFTLPALSLNSGQTYRIKFGYERGRNDANTTNTGLVYPENLALYENFGVQPTNTTGIPGGASAIPLFASTVTTDGHNVASLTFTPSVSGAYYFSWYSNTPHPSAGITVAGGLIAVDSIKIDSFGCNPPVITFQPQNSAVCLGNTASLNVSASGYGLTYQWYKNNALLPAATASVLNIANAQAGDAAQYRVTVTGTCGGVQNVQSNTVNLVVSNYPTDTITTTTSTSFCAGGSVVLTANTAAGNSYQWKVNGNFIPNAFSQTYTATTAGTYQSVSTNQYGCATTSPSVPVTVLSASSVTISPSGPTTFCNGGSVTLTANTGTGITYQWLVNGVPVTPANTTNVLVTGISGNYTVTETATGNGCSVTFPTPIPVIVNGPTSAPAISAAGPLSFCLGGFVTLTTPTVTPPAGQPAYSYLWYKDSVAISGAQATTTSYTASASGKYFVTVSQNNCALKSVIDTVKVDAPPTTVLNNGTIICSGNVIVLTAPVGPGLSYQWKNNGINIPGATSNVFNDTIAGAFQVVVTDAFPCTATSSVTTVTVGAPPSAVILATGPTLFCPGDSVKIRTNYDTSLSYVWSVSTASAAGPYTTLPSIVASPTGHYDSVRIFKTSGYYRVTEANGPCQSTSTPIQVTVSAIPNPTIVSSGSDSLCPGGSVTLSTQLGNTYTYQWLKDGVNVPGAISPTFVVNSSNVNPGTGSSFKLIATNVTGCKGVALPVTVTAFSNPNVNVTSAGSDSICSGSSVTLSTTAGVGYTYQWTLNNLPLSNANQSFYNASNAGSYKVTVTSAQGCAATTPAATIVSVLPVPSTNVVASGSTSFCSPGSVTLSAVNGGGLTYQWQMLSGANITNIAGATSASFNDSVSGNIRVVISNGVCAVASIVTAVTVSTPPVVSINAGGATTFCQGGSVLLSAGSLSGNYTYQWKLGNGNINTGGTLPTYSATAPGVYTLLATSGNCVSTSSSITVKVNALPKDTVELATIAGNRNPGCAGTPVVLEDKNSAPGFSYQWKLNGGNVGSNGTSVAYPALTAGMYSFSVTDTNGCKNASGNSMNVTFDPLPNPTIASNGNGSTLTTGTFVTYQWQLNGVNISGATANGYTVLQPGKYRVIVTNSYGCTGISDEYTSTVGVGSVSKADVRIYPNPVTSVVHIDAPVKVNVTISALDGKKIVEGRGVNEVDLSGLANGVYLITVYDENNIAIKIDKLVKTGR